MSVIEKCLVGEKMAVLVANGFNETDFTEAQRVLQETGVHIRIISMDNGLVNSWKEGGWGLHFAADQALNTALAADYSMLLIPGGRRSIDKLKLTAHTRRFIGGFMDVGKPVVAFGDSLDLLGFVEKLDGRVVTGDDSLREGAVKAGAQWSEGSDYAIDGALMTGVSTPDALSDMQKFLVSSFEIDQAA